MDGKKIAGQWEMMSLDNKISEATDQNKVKDIIKAIIENIGMKCYFRETVSKKGDGTSKIYVRASKYSPIKGANIVVDLGNIEKVQEWTPRHLTETLNSRLKEKVEQERDNAN